MMLDRRIYAFDMEQIVGEQFSQAGRLWKDSSLHIQKYREDRNLEIEHRRDRMLSGVHVRQMPMPLLLSNVTICTS